MLGDDLVQEILQAVNSASIPDGWNDTTFSGVGSIQWRQG